MKRVNLTQDGDDWLKWRRTCLTASDAAIIMGLSPYCDIDTLRMRKLGLIQEEPCNKWMQRGKDLEPVARKSFIECTGIYVEPAIVESTDYPFLGASLDGISSCGKFLLEVKCGKASHKLALKGEIPIYYLSQIQHQLICTRAEKCYYYSFDGTDGVCIEVLPDLEFEKDYIPKAVEFWMSLLFYIFEIKH